MDETIAAPAAEPETSDRDLERSLLADLLASSRLYRTTEDYQALMAFVNKSPSPPDKPPTLREAVRAIAKLGGFIGRKSDGEPGVKVLWRGWIRLQDIVETWTLLHSHQDVGNA